MSELGRRLTQLGLASYVQRLTSEGFDTWETVLDITESDLSTLGFKLGHRRKLQRAIAESRGQPVERALHLEDGKVAAQDEYPSDDSTQDAKESSGQVAPATARQSSGQLSAGTKRKYRRHPKSLKQADEHAPERPPSAYVIFSNQIREELKGQDMSFTDIAKLVGERWQVLDPPIREAYEKQAASAKERYYAQMAEYKKTAQYQEYQQYLADFKAKHTSPRAEGKRSKTQPHAASDSTTKAIGSQGRRGSLAESVTTGHLRTPSNPNNPGLGVYGGYAPPSSSTSPAQAPIGLQSPLTQHAYSPRTSPPPSGPGFATSYELPHHARGTLSAADIRSRDYSAAQVAQTTQMARHWQHSPVDETTSHAPSSTDYFPRRSSRALQSLPALVHQDTTGSSLGDSLPTPLLHEAHILPPLDPTKADRTLPTPLPSILSPLDGRHQKSAAITLPPVQTTPSTQTAHFDALLQASEMARNADLQDKAARSAGSSR